MRDMRFMRDLIGTSALALIFTVGVAGAQTPNEPAPNEPAPNMQQSSPKGSQTEPGPAGTMRDETIAPPEDVVVGPPESEAGQRDPENLAGTPEGDATGTHRDLSEIPGASPQTMPAKYSRENAERLEYSIMGYPVQLSDEQKRAIWQSIGSRSSTASTLGETIHAEAGVFLPPNVEAEELPGNLNEQIPAVRGLKYVKVDDKVLLVQPSNSIVRGVIEEE